MVSSLGIKSVKVLIVPEYGDFGGTLTFLQKLLNFHQKYHIQSAVAVKKKQLFPEIIAFFKELDIQTYKIPERPKIFGKPYFSLIYDIFSCWEAYRSFQPDLIIVSTGTPPLMLGTFAFPTPVLFIIHSYPKVKLRYGMRHLVYLLSRYGNYFMTVSQFSATRIHECMGVSSDRMSIIYNSYTPQVTLNPSQTKEKIILTIGHVNDYKNPEIWLSVAQKVLDQAPDAQFIWLGDGVLYNEIVTQVKKLGLDKKVLLPGYCKNVVSYYTKSMIYFQPSLLESHGIAVIEAMSYGLPCVTSDAGGLPESVIHCETGYTCSPEDIDCFSSKLIKLLENPELREKMGDSGQKRAKDLFSEEVQESNLLNLYQFILNSNVSRSR